MSQQKVSTTHNRLAKQWSTAMAASPSNDPLTQQSTDIVSSSSATPTTQQLDTPLINKSNDMVTSTSTNPTTQQLDNPLINQSNSTPVPDVPQHLDDEKGKFSCEFVPAPGAEERDRMDGQILTNAV